MYIPNVIRPIDNNAPDFTFSNVKNSNTDAATVTFISDINDPNYGMFYINRVGQGTSIVTIDYTNGTNISGTFIIHFVE